MLTLIQEMEKVDISFTRWKISLSLLATRTAFSPSDQNPDCSIKEAAILDNWDHFWNFIRKLEDDKIVYFKL